MYEPELFIILTFYEIKGTPIITIKKYFPNFYSKIYNYYQQFKKINIYQLCLKQSRDIKFIEDFQNLLKNNSLIHNYNNFSFIIEREYKLNITNKDSVEINLFNLIENDDIKPFYDTGKVDIFFEELNKNDFMKINKFYKEFIFSLIDFNRTSSIIIEKCQKKNNSKYGEIYYEYLNYLRIVKSIYKNANINDSKNENLYEINILNESLSKYSKNKLNSMRNSININEITFLILKGAKDLKMDKNVFFITLNNSVNDTINKKIDKENILKEEISLLSFFKYLNLVCDILINWLDKFEEIDKIQDIINDKYSKIDCANNSFMENIKIRKGINIQFKNNENKENSKKEFQNSLFVLGQEIFKDYFNFDNKVINENNDKKYNLSIYFYFNEVNGNFFETNTDINLFYYIDNKIEDIFELFIELNNLKESISLKNISLIFNQSTTIFEINIVNDIFETFKPLLGFEDIFNSYLKRSSEYCFYGCQNYLQYEIKRIIFNYIFPSLSFNYYLSGFCQNTSYQKYNNYIDFSNIINEIKNTKYHDNDNLNSLFQIKAINYIINGDSFFHIFLRELYNTIYKKNNKHVLLKKNNINAKFKFQLINGKKYNENDSIKIQNKNSLNSETSSLRSSTKKNKKIKYKLKTVNTNEDKQNNKIFYSIISLNQFKRKNVPNSSFVGYIPGSQFSLGQSVEKYSNNIFNNRINIRSKPSDELLNYKKNKDHPEKRHYKKYKSNKQKFINVFDLIYTIKNCHDGIIELEKNDISEILKLYSEPNTFMSLINYKFSKKNEEIYKSLEKFILDDILK